MPLPAHEPKKYVPLYVKERDVRVVRAWLRERVIEFEDDETIKEMLFSIYQELGKP